MLITEPILRVSESENFSGTRPSHFPLPVEKSTQVGYKADLFAEAIPNKVIKEASQRGKSSIFISRKAKKVYLLRYLLGKFRYQSENISLKDILTLYKIFLDVQDLTINDQNFQQKFGSTLEVVALQLKGVQIRNLKEPGLRALEKAIKKIPEDFILPKRNLKQAQKKLEGLYQLRPFKIEGTPLDQLPPKLFIGKGYSDKGTARNPAVDGRQGWQEIAMHRGVIYD